MEKVSQATSRQQSKVQPIGSQFVIGIKAKSNFGDSWPANCPVWKKDESSEIQPIFEFVADEFEWSKDIEE